MPARSKIFTLPEEVKAELDKRLVAGGFSDYGTLAAWLQEKGFEISRSAVHRYGQEFEAKLAAIKIATEQARAITEAVGDDQGMMGDALTRMAQEKAFQVLMKMEAENIAGDVYLPHLGRMVAELNKSSIAQKKWMAEIREKTKKAIENIEQKAKKLTPEDLKVIREEIYGIA